MKSFDFLFQQLEQEQRHLANRAAKKLAQNAQHFWDQLCAQAQSHPNPKIRKRLIFIIATAPKVSTEQKKLALRKLLDADSENSEDIRLMLQYWF